MPYSFESKSKKIPQSHDRRIKLSDIQRQEIIEKYSTGKYTYMELASMYKVSKALIGFVVHPEVYEHNKETKVNKYDGSKRSQQMASHRAYKKSLDESGILIENDKKAEK